MQNALISIIIPVFNMEKFLSKCLESVLNQTYKNLEVIIVDDGSIDGSLKIAYDYVKKDKRFKIVRKQNSGVSDTRNLGIEISKGEYISFIDADDWINEKMYEELFKSIKEYEADLAICNYIKEGKNIEYFNCDIDELSLEEENINDKFLYPLIETSYYDDNHKLSGFRGPVCKLYSKKIINKENIRFKTDLVIGEDFIFNLEYLKYINKIAINQGYFYHYRTNLDSATMKYKKKCWEIYSKLIINITDYLEKNGEKEKYNFRLNKLILKYLKICIHNEFLNTSLNKKDIINNLNVICSDNIIIQALEYGKKNKLITGIVLKFALKKRVKLIYYYYYFKNIVLKNY